MRITPIIRLLFWSFKAYTLLKGFLPNSTSSLIRYYTRRSLRIIKKAKGHSRLLLLGPITRTFTPNTAFFRRFESILFQLTFYSTSQIIEFILDIIDVFNNPIATDPSSISMSFCCRTCDHRNHALATNTTETLLDVCLITLTFQTEIVESNRPSYVALNTMLNNITDAAESTSHPTFFTMWSPCLSDPKTAVIISTAAETLHSPTSTIFEPILQYLSKPPGVQHIFLDRSVLSLAASSPEQRIASDVMIVRAPNPGVAGAIGRQFGWNPKRSALSSQAEIGAPGGSFSHPGDLIRDFWAWAELSSEDPTSPSSSSAGSGWESSGSRPGLISTNSEEKNMSLFWAEDDERRNMEDETLVMIFQWNSHLDGDRFKHPLQRSLGQNSREVSDDMWDRHVAHPVRQLQGIGAKVETYKVDLRGVESRIDFGRSSLRDRVAGRRLSTMASGLGERVTGLWNR
ncbi:unnamed protein product [Periconia digitata]|uniref:Uncharacterized protein n=1 Tax=Periconia digitata TaxID=1303443 RepID=A0A9W4UNS8_9PLEO|nr:unnamed protein product [Periconia digitata]